jgi:hypothetical protein
MENAAQRIQANLEHLSTQGADAAQIADAAVTIWRDINAALSPLIGQRGVTALYKRSLYLSRGDYPWLAAVAEGALHASDFTSLRTALAQQTSANASAANGVLLNAFTELLTNLVGVSLTERLLLSVWEHHSNGHSEQENT